MTLCDCNLFLYLWFGLWDLLFFLWFWRVWICSVFLLCLVFFFRKIDGDLIMFNVGFLILGWSWWLWLFRDFFDDIMLFLLVFATAVTGRRFRCFKAWFTLTCCLIRMFILLLWLFSQSCLLFQVYLWSHLYHGSMICLIEEPRRATFPWIVWFDPEGSCSQS